MAFDEPEIRLLFPVPFISVRLTAAEELNRRLLSEIGQRREEEAGIGRSNRQGWHSALDFFDRREPAHSELARELEAITAATTAKLIPEMPANLVARYEGWINASPAHAMNIPHDHSGAFWSGTYYVHVPAPEDPSDVHSGAIEFIDPRGPIGTASQIETPFTRSKHTVRPKAGTCLLWPGFVRHWVYPNESPEDRVAVAFNSWFAREPA